MSSFLVFETEIQIQIQIDNVEIIMKIIIIKKKKNSNHKNCSPPFGGLVWHIYNIELKYIIIYVQDLKEFKYIMDTK